MAFPHSWNDKTRPIRLRRKGGVAERESDKVIVALMARQNKLVGAKGLDFGGRFRMRRRIGDCR